MATSSYAKSLLGGIPSELKSAFTRVMEYIFDGNLRFGAIDHQQRAENFAGVFLNSTTAATANQEFSMLHGLTRVPNVVIPVLDPRAVNARLIGDLTISRAADEMRVYFTSASTGAAFTIYLE